MSEESDKNDAEELIAQVDVTNTLIRAFRPKGIDAELAINTVRGVIDGVPIYFDQIEIKRISPQSRSRMRNSGLKTDVGIGKGIGGVVVTST